MVDPGLAAIIAAGVSLALGLIVVVQSSLATTAARKDAVAERRAAALVNLLKVVETRGLYVQDTIFNVTVRGDEQLDMVVLPRRKGAEPPRTDRGEARALLAAYGTPAIRAAFDSWIVVLDAWERKYESFRFDYDLNGPTARTPEEGSPEREEEEHARARLGLEVQKALGTDS